MTDTLDDLILGPIYANDLIACDAYYNGASDPIRIIDMSQGADVGPAEASSVTIRPVAHVRRASVAAEPSQHALVIKGIAYRIESWRPKLSGSGVTTGELILVLRKT